MDFRFDVFSSEVACGHANVTIDGQILPVTGNGDVLSGKGPVTLDRKTVVLASWTFHCIKVNGQPHSQFLKFHVDVVEGRPVEDTGFSALFRQTSTTEIIRINSDLRIPDMIAANPNPEGLLPSGESIIPFNSLQKEFMELDWLMAQMHELQFLIDEKKQSIANHASKHYQEDIKDCDSLRCVVAAVAKKIKHAAHDVYGKIAGDDDFEEAGHGHFPKPHWPKIPFPGRGKHGNHTYGPPHPMPGHGKRPHRFLPICRMPPPRRHRGPHHPPGGHHPPPPPPGHHDQGRFRDGPHHDGPPNRDHEDGPFPHHPGDHPPPHDREDRSPPHHFEEGLPPHALEHGPPRHHENGPPRHFKDGPPPHPPPQHRGPPPIVKALFLAKYASIAIICAFLIRCIHRRVCTPKRKANRKARREERRERRRVAHKNAITRLLARMAGSGSDGEHSSDSYEEKREETLSDMEDGLSTTMTEEIHQLQNAASVVDDMVCAEEGRLREQVPAAPIYTPATYTPIPALLETQPIPIPTQDSAPLMQTYYMSGDEELPAYEDDESELDSIVSDGFRYMPGTSTYSPSHSASGSVSEILGPDTKS